MAAAFSIIAGASCTGGVVPGAGGQITDPPAADEGAPASTPAGGVAFRRLTLTQLTSSMRALLGINVALSRDLVEASVPGFDVYATMAASVVGYDRGQLRAVYDSAMAAAERAFANQGWRTKLVGCTPSRADDECVRRFLTSFGQRAFRRPLTDDEYKRYAGVVRDSSALLQNDVWAGLKFAVAGFLQSPKFLFIDEVGEPLPGSPGTYRYTSWEMAARLSYALTNGPPDADLQVDAQRGALVEPAAIRTHAERLVASVDGKTAVVQGFLGQHFGAARLAGLEKKPAAFPRWTPALAASLRQESEQLLEAAIFRDDATMSDLLTRRSTFLDPSLAALYDVPWPGGSVMKELALPAGGPRQGILGTGAFLATHSFYDRTSPTLRGRFLMQRLLCRATPDPPPNLNATLAESGGTVRQRLEAHRTAACASCHTLMDPPGLTLEHFDAIGAFRDTDGGQAIDSTGDFDGHAIDGLRGLSDALAASPGLSPCLARQAFRYQTGQLETEEQRPAIEALAARARGKVRALMVEIAASPLFRTFPAKGRQP